VLLRMLVRSGRPPGDLLLYAWHPLVVMEVAGSGHNDVLGTLFLLLALAAWQGGRRNRAALALALSALAKVLPLALLPFTRSARRMLLALALFAVAFIPYAGAGKGLYAGAAFYGTELLFNGSVFPLLDRVLPPGTARPVAAGLFLLLVILALVRRVSLPGAAMLVVGAGLCLSSQFHPWYLLWMLPLLVLRPALSWHLLAFTSMFSYRVHAANKFEGIWEESDLLRILEYAPFYAVLALELLRDLKKARRARRARRAEAFARARGLVPEGGGTSGHPAPDV
jgi:hypothetical protein